MSHSPTKKFVSFRFLIAMQTVPIVVIPGNIYSLLKYPIFATMPKEFTKCSKYLVTTRQNEKRKRRNLIIYFMVKAPCYKDFLEGIIKKWDSENLTSFLIRYNISYHIYWSGETTNSTLLCFVRLFRQKSKTSVLFIG